MEFLITNTRDGFTRWVAAPNWRDALRYHEEARRSDNGEVRLSLGSKVGVDTGRGAAVIDAWLGDSAIRGPWSAVSRRSA